MGVIASQGWPVMGELCPLLKFFLLGVQNNNIYFCSDV
jgi:hypothetical protein